MKKPHILLTNDDGINAEGLRRLCLALAPMAKLTIVAPIVERSTSGLSVTVRDPISIQTSTLFEEIPAWSVTGTPVDCVRMALNLLFKDSKPDLIVSGINHGSNAGGTVLYSGTVAAAIDGVMRGIPGIAVSCTDWYHPNYTEATKHVPAVVHHVLNHPLPHGTILNVNFPMAEGEQVRGFRMTKQGREFWAEDLIERPHPWNEGDSYYWMGAKAMQFEEDEDCDIVWLRRGYMTAVPIHIAQLTDYAHLDRYGAHFADLFNK